MGAACAAQATEVAWAQSCRLPVGGANTCRADFRPVRLVRGGEAFEVSFHMPPVMRGLLVLACDPGGGMAAAAGTLPAAADGLAVLQVGAAAPTLEEALPGGDIGNWAGRLIEAVCWANRRPACQGPVFLLGERCGGAAAIEAAAALGERVQALALLEARMDLVSRVALAVLAVPVLTLPGRRIGGLGASAFPEPAAVRILDWVNQGMEAHAS